MSRTQKNKATNAHLGLLKAKLAKLKRELINPKGGGGSQKEVWHLTSVLFLFHFLISFPFFLTHRRVLRYRRPGMQEWDL